MKTYYTFTEAFWSLVQTTTGIIPTDEGSSRIDPDTNTLKTLFPRLNKDVAKSIPPNITDIGDYRSWKAGKSYGMAKKKKQMATMTVGLFEGVDMLNEDAMDTVMAEPSCLGIMPGDGSDEEGDQDIVAWQPLGWSTQAGQLRALGGGVNQDLRLVGRKFMLKFFKDLKLTDRKIISLDPGLARFESLEELSLTNNSITVLEHLPASVKILHVDCNEIEDVSNLRGVKLVHLGLAFNRISDVRNVVPPVDMGGDPSIPASIHLSHPLATLMSLDLSSNNLTDLQKTCTHLSYLPKLRHLCMNGNPFCFHSYYRAYTITALDRLLNLDEEDILEEDRIASEAALGADEDVEVPKEYGEGDEPPAEGAPPQMTTVKKNVCDAPRQGKLVLCVDSVSGLKPDRPKSASAEAAGGKGGKGKEVAPTGPPPNTIHLEMTAFGEDIVIGPVEEEEVVNFNWCRTFEPDLNARVRDYIVIHGIPVVVKKTSYFYIEKELTEEERLAKEAAEAEAAAAKGKKGAAAAQEEEKEVGSTVTEVGRTLIRCPAFFNGSFKPAPVMDTPCPVAPVPKVDYRSEIKYRHKDMFKKHKSSKKTATVVAPKETPSVKKAPEPTVFLNVRAIANCLEDPKETERKRLEAEEAANANAKGGAAKKKK